MIPFKTEIDKGATRDFCHMEAMFGHQEVAYHVGATIWLIGIVRMHNKLMNTPSMIVSPSILLLQHHVGGFHASDLEFLPTFRQCLAIKWGHALMQVL